MLKALGSTPHTAWPGHDGTHLESQHSGSRGRRIRSWGSPLAYIASLRTNLSCTGHSLNKRKKTWQSVKKNLKRKTLQDILHWVSHIWGSTVHISSGQPRSSARHPQVWSKATLSSSIHLGKGVNKTDRTPLSRALCSSESNPTGLCGAFNYRVRNCQLAFGVVTQTQ